MNTEIKILTPQDIDEFKELVYLFRDVFELKDFISPDDQYLQDLLKNPNFLTMIAKAEGKVLGGLTVYILDHYYSKKPYAYIYDLAVLKEHQRKGVGKSLIKYLTDYCKVNGFEEVFVQADRVEDYALEFYRSTKPTAEEDVVHYCYSL